MENTSILAYNNELSLSCAITIAYYTAKRAYTLIRELSTGKGFADIAFIPRRNTDKPAILVELKWNHSAKGAINQIRTNQYDGALEEYVDDLLLVGICYDKQKKKYECKIESIENRLFI